MPNPASEGPAAPAADHRVEIVRGRLDPALSKRLIDFWTGHGALREADAQKRLDEVVGVLFDRSREIAGVCSAYAAVAPLVRRRVWMYRRFLLPDVEEGSDLALVQAAFDELASSFTGAPDQPLGLCVMVGDREFMKRHDEAIWPQAELLFAGYTQAGAQVRIRYFDGARI